MMHLDKKALLPCPFCGSEASADGKVTYGKYHVREQDWEQDTFYFCNCPACGVSNVGIIGHRTRGDAIEAWNRRASPTLSSSPVSGLVERLRSQATLPVCPFSRRSPDYWTSGENGAACTVCGGTEDGPDKCTGADLRIMAEAADRLTALAAQLAEMEAENARLRESREFWKRVSNGWSQRTEAYKARLAEALKALDLFEHYGCPICHGDCASANPPVDSCPMQAASRVRKGG